MISKINPLEGERKRRRKRIPEMDLRIDSEDQLQGYRAVYSPIKRNASGKTSCTLKLVSEQNKTLEKNEYIYIKSETYFGKIGCDG